MENSYKKNENESTQSSQEEEESSIQSFEENLQISSTSSNSTSSSPYSAELVQTPTNGSFSSRISSVYEVLQEIKPEHPLHYKWRKRCRMASIWVVVASAIILIIFLIIEQRHKAGM
ncbi:10967_t:CDS:2 [Rhizophagus irregularis]|nr:10967_t:CDS:2 [Rhizophagus irregularis]